LSGKAMAITGNTAGSLIGVAKNDGFIESKSRSKISNVHLTGPVSIHGSSAGGLIGQAGDVDIGNSDVRGDINGTSSTGGLVGSCSDCTITDCSAIGTVTSETTLGDVGGLAGSTRYSTITGSYAITKLSSTAGDVSENLGPEPRLSRIANDVGGLIGNSSEDTIENSFAAGTVYGDSRVGGLVGYLGSGSKIRATYANVEKIALLSSQCTLSTKNDFSRPGTLFHLFLFPFFFSSSSPSPAHLPPTKTIAELTSAVCCASKRSLVV
jgi:hypothetical protein